MYIFPEKYEPPNGALLIVFVDAEAAGYIALSRISENTCEMKRLFLRKDYRGLGIGRKLVHMIVEKAFSLNYSYMRLDTLSSMDKAQKIYESIGFTDIKPYRYNPIKEARSESLDNGVTLQDLDW